MSDESAVLRDSGSMNAMQLKSENHLSNLNVHSAVQSVVESQALSSQESINDAFGINNLSYTHVPVMPDLYLPFNQMVELNPASQDKAVCAEQI